MVEYETIGEEGLRSKDGCLARINGEVGILKYFRPFLGIEDFGVIRPGKQAYFLEDGDHVEIKASPWKTYEVRLR